MTSEFSRIIYNQLSHAADILIIAAAAGLAVYVTVYSVAVYRFACEHKTAKSIAYHSMLLLFFAGVIFALPKMMG